MIELKEFLNISTLRIDDLMLLFLWGQILIWLSGIAMGAITRKNKYIFLLTAFVAIIFGFVISCQVVGEVAYHWMPNLVNYPKLDTIPSIISTIISMGFFFCGYLFIWYVKKNL